MFRLIASLAPEMAAANKKDQVTCIWSMGSGDDCGTGPEWAAALTHRYNRAFKIKEQN